MNCGISAIYLEAFPQANTQTPLTGCNIQPQLVKVQSAEVADISQIFREKQMKPRTKDGY